jgi:hypothetical protein
MVVHPDMKIHIGTDERFGKNPNRGKIKNAPCGCGPVPRAPINARAGAGDLSS